MISIRICTLLKILGYLSCRSLFLVLLVCVNDLLDFAC
jgi:hypothetical protein